jgi:hypothetical protein
VPGAIGTGTRCLLRLRSRKSHFGGGPSGGCGSLVALAAFKGVGGGCAGDVGMIDGADLGLAFSGTVSVSSFNSVDLAATGAVDMGFMRGMTTKHRVFAAGVAAVASTNSDSAGSFCGICDGRGRGVVSGGGLAQEAPSGFGNIGGRGLAQGARSGVGNISGRSLAEVPGAIVVAVGGLSLVPGAIAIAAGGIALVPGAHDADGGSMGGGRNIVLHANGQ